MSLSGSFARAVARGRRLLPVCMFLLAAQLLQVNAFGDCIINGPGGTCALATNTYTAIPATNVSSLTYSWLITNDTAATVFVGNTNSASVQVLSATNGAFLLQCTVSAGTNSNFQTCATNIVVNSPALPTIVCPSNLVFNCAQDVPPPDTNSVSVSGATSVTFAGDLVTTNTCGLSILRS